MRRNNFTFGKYFCGNEISAYGRKHGRVDYATLAKAFDAVLANGILEKTWGTVGEWEQENGFIDNSEEIEEKRDKIEELENAIDAEEIPEEDAREEIESLEEEIEELEDEQDGNSEIFQYFIISSQGAEILEEYTNEIVFYNSELDLYVWGVTHWGTSWDYVLTDIPCEVDETAEA